MGNNCGGYCLSEQNSEFKHKVTVERPGPSEGTGSVGIDNKKYGEFEIEYNKKGTMQWRTSGPDGGDKVNNASHMSHNTSQYIGERVNGKKHGRGE